MRADFPGEIGLHAALDDLIPLTLFILVDAVRITDRIEHFMRVVIAETEARTPAFVFVVGFYGVAQAAGLSDDRHRAVAQRHELRQAAGFKLGRH